MPHPAVTAPHEHARLPENVRVLVVEDDADARSGLSQRLRHDRFEPLFAVDVPGALRLARLQKPDVIILDLGLPGGDGYLFMERLRAMPELAQIPIIVLSAREPAVERQRVLDAGAVAYYQKPMRNNVLKAAIFQALEA